MENPFVAYYRSPIGTMEIKCSGETIISAVFIDDFSDYPPLPENRTLEDCILQLREYFNGQRREFELQTDQDGTEYRQMVWNKINTVPFGKTLTYRELAIRTGSVKNLRSAATANGKNKLAIIVPCHRIIGNNNDLTGYAWGLWRKRWLLDHEGKIANGIVQLF